MSMPPVRFEMSGLSKKLVIFIKVEYDIAIFIFKIFISSTIIK